MRPYLCGPVSACMAAEEALRTLGIAPVYGPHDIVRPATATPADRAAKRMEMLLGCDTVVLLDGWASDSMTEREHDRARSLGMRCVPLVIVLSGG